MRNADFNSRARVHSCTSKGNTKAVRSGGMVEEVNNVERFEIKMPEAVDDDCLAQMDFASAAFIWTRVDSELHRTATPPGTVAGDMLSANPPDDGVGESEESPMTIKVEARMSRRFPTLST